MGGPSCRTFRHCNSKADRLGSAIDSLESELDRPYDLVLADETPADENEAMHQQLNFQWPGMCAEEKVN